MSGVMVLTLAFALLIPLCSEAFELSDFSISDSSHMLYIFDAPTAYLLKEDETTFLLASYVPVYSSFFSRWAWHLSESAMGLGNFSLDIKKEPENTSTKTQKSSTFLNFHCFFGGRTKLLNVGYFHISTEEGIAGFYTSGKGDPSLYYISLYLTPILSIKMRSIGVHMNFRYEYKYVHRRIPGGDDGISDHYESEFKSEFDGPGIGINCGLNESTALLFEGKYQDNSANLALGAMVYRDLLRAKVGCEISISADNAVNFRQLLFLRGPM